MMKKKIASIAVLLTLLTTLNFVNTCYANTIDTELSRDKVTLGDTVTLTFAIDRNSSTTQPDFSALNNDFRILNVNFVNTVNVVNGVSATQTFWRLTVSPKRPGTLTIPEIVIGDDITAARQLVVEPSANQPANNTNIVPAFVQAEISISSPYVQAQVIYTFKLYYQTRLENSAIEIPQVKDATFLQLGEGKQYETVVKGKPYYVVEKSLALFPQKAGKLFIPSTQFHAITYDDSTNTTDDPFYMPAPRALSLLTKDFTLNVQPTPTSFQGSTWLPASDITIKEDWSLPPDQWEAGNPVIRTLTVEARGLRADQLPDLSIEKMPGITLYVDSPKRSNAVQEKMVTGTLQQKITYVPTASQTYTIPAIQINWWNTATNTPQIARSNALVVHPKAGMNKASPSPSVVAPTPAPAPVNTAPPSVTPFYKTIWFWIAAFFFTSWLITIIIMMKKKSAKQSHVKVSTSTPNLSSANPSPSEADFIQACKHGNAALAQHYLLGFAKSQGYEGVMNLENLREIINEEHFNSAIVALEQALYGRKAEAWDGQALLTAYQKIKKQKRHGSVKKRHDHHASHSTLEPLPPLNP